MSLAHNTKTVRKTLEERGMIDGIEGSTEIKGKKQSPRDEQEMSWLIGGIYMPIVMD